jgi:hypothetical protein
MTRYLMFKVALQLSDKELAAECIKIVHETSMEDATLLYACVLEAQDVGDKVQAATAMQLILDKYEFSTPDSVHLPALLRYLRFIMTLVLYFNRHFQVYITASDVHHCR